MCRSLSDGQLLQRPPNDVMVWVKGNANQWGVSTDCCKNVSCPNKLLPFIKTFHSMITDMEDSHRHARHLDGCYPGRMHHCHKSRMWLL